MNYRQKTAGRVSSSKLRAFIDCPHKYKLQYLDGLGLEDRDCFVLGRAFEDILRLPREEFDEKYKLTPAKLATVERAAAEAKRNPLFDYGGDYKTGVWLEAEYTARNGTKLLLCGEIDRLGNGLIRDYKLVANIAKFERYGVSDYGYHLQLAFYQLMEAVANGHPTQFLDVRLDVVDKTKNAVCCCYPFPPEVMAQARQEMIDALERLAEREDFTPDFSGEDMRINKCAKCDMYQHCPFARQKSLSFLTL